MDSQSNPRNQIQTVENNFKGFSKEMQICIQNCSVCHQVCLQTLAYCLKQDGEYLKPKHLKNLMDCAQICMVSADFMSRDSELQKAVSEVCANACLACAESCEQFADDQTLRLCADICRQCEESCGQMKTMNH